MEEYQRGIAAELGFVESPCSACRPAPDPACPNCEGVGLVWRNGAASLARSGMVRLVRWTLANRESGER